MTLSFNRNFDPRHGEAVDVAPGVRRVTAANPSPFTFQGTNTFLIGDRELAVLDPGPDDPVHLQALLRAIGSADVRHILVSHSHRDHAPGAQPLKAATGAPVSAALRAPTKAGAGGTSRRLDAAPDIGFVPDHVLADGETISVDRYLLEAIATPGHASDHMAFSLKDSEILFAGDHVMGWSTSVVAPPDGSMRDYIASLDRLLFRPESVYLPAHGAPISNAGTYVKALKTHRLMRERAILERLAEGDRTIPAIVARNYRDTDPRLHGAAALSTLAHLEDLVDRRLVLSDGPPSLAATYWPADVSSSAGAGSSEIAATGGPKAPIS